MEQNARADPRVWDLGWLVLRRQGQAIRRLLANPALQLHGARVLDFGCGTRPYEPWLCAMGARYEGADIDAGHEVLVREDGMLSAAAATYDMVTSFQVLEHVWDLSVYLGEAWRVLKPGGSLLLSTHGSWFYHPHPGDYRRWTREGLRREVEARGFRLIDMHAVVGPLAWTTVLRSYGYAYALRPIPLAGPVLCASAALLANLLAWVEDRVTPTHITADNACVYVGLFQREGE